MRLQLGVGVSVGIGVEIGVGIGVGIGIVIVIMSVFRTRSGRELFVSTDYSTREYDPAEKPVVLIVKVAEVEEFAMLTKNSSEPVFYRRFIANVTQEEISS